MAVKTKKKKKKNGMEIIAFRIPAELKRELKLFALQAPKFTSMQTLATQAISDFIKNNTVIRIARVDRDRE